MTKIDKILKREIEIAPSKYQAPKTYMVEIARSGITFREKGRRAVIGPLPWSVMLSRAEMYDAKIGSGK